MTFKNKNRLEVHQKTEHFGEKGHCGVCNVTVTDVHAWNAHESEHHLGKCDVCGCDGFNDLKLMRTHHSVAHRGYQVWSLKKNLVICLLSVDGPLAYFDGKIGRSNFRAITAQLTVLKIFL